MTFHDVILDFLKSFKIIQLIELATIIIVAIITSLVINRIILPRLRKRAARTQSAFQRMLFKSLKGEITIWIYGLGVYLILQVLRPMSFMTPSIYGTVATVIGFIVLFSFLWFIRDLSDEIINYYARKGTIPRSSLFGNLIKYAIIILFVILILDQFGISITSFIAALGIGGLAIALALQETLSNIIAGLSVITSGQIQEGEYIELDSGESGYVTDISWRNTTIRTLDQELVIIPNSKLSNSTIKNTGKPMQETRLRVHVGVGYESDLDLVEKVTLEVAKKVVADHPKGITEFTPILLFNELADSSINYSVVMKVQDFDARRQVRHQFIKSLIKTYREHNINIPFPIRTVQMEKSS